MATAKPNATKLVSPEVVAEHLDVDARTINRWACEGRLPSVPITRKVRRFDLPAVINAITNKAH